MTCYQAASTVERALRSIADDVVTVGGEIVVVDDGSTDDTVPIVRRVAETSDAEIRLVEAGRLGRSAALNLAVAHARGPFLANLDADDISLPGRLPAQLEAMAEDPQLGVLGGRFVRFELDRNLAFLQSFPAADDRIRRAFAWSGPFCHSTVMYRRQAVLEAGGFAEDERVRIDHHLWIRIGALGYRFRNLEQVMAIHFKTSRSYFASASSERDLARNMFQRNRTAIQRLDLPRRFNVIAALRLGFRFVPEGFRLRITPGATALSSTKLDTYHPGLQDDRPEPVRLLRIGEVIECDGLPPMTVTTVTQRNWSRVATAAAGPDRFFVKQFVDRVGAPHDKGFRGDQEVMESLDREVCPGLSVVPVIGRDQDRLLAISPYIEMSTIDSIGRSRDWDVERAATVGVALRTLLDNRTIEDDPDKVSVWKGLDPKNVGWSEDGRLWVFDFGPAVVLDRAEAAARVIAAGLLCRWVARVGIHVLWPEGPLLRAVCEPLADLSDLEMVRSELAMHAELRFREPQRTGWGAVMTRFGLRTVGRLHWAAVDHHARKVFRES